MTKADIAPMRPPAVPLIACDPYLSVWSFANNLTGEQTKHWSGSVQSLASVIRIDGTAYRLMGVEPRGGLALPQTSVEVLPTRTIYRFAGEGVGVTLTFMTPSLPHDLEKLSWPVTYITWDIVATDGASHDIELYFDAASTLATNTLDDKVVWGRLQLDGDNVPFVGSQQQPVLAKSGDNLRIDWGYLYSISPDKDAVTAFGFQRWLRQGFANNGQLPENDPFEMPQPARRMAIATSFTLGAVDAQGVSRTVILAYDDQYSIEYLDRKLRPYWRRSGWTAPDLLKAVLEERTSVQAACERLDAELMADMAQVGGEKYARLCALSFRQCLAAHKLAADFDGTPLFFSKENFSNGCIATVDVTYPAAPFYLFLNPELLKGTMRPILEYASLPRWRFPFAPHDIGTYPLANGQVYGGGELTEENQMPVEECGNMLILAGALATYEKNLDFFTPYWSLLRGWAEYLVEKGFDPDNQLCTDDFAGHLAHNTNLSIKAILGIACFARLCEMKGEAEDARGFRETALRFARQWEEQAADGDHYRLTFDRPGTWSQKYNLVWDRLLDLQVFGPEVARTEIAFYLQQQNEFGLPLDSRSTWTKLDWIVWTATLAESAADFTAFIDPIYEFINRSPSRVPLTDWYFTDSGKQRGFQARSVVGGVFIKALQNDELRRRWVAKSTSAQ